MQKAYIAGDFFGKKIVSREVLPQRTLFSGRGAARAEDAQGTPTQSHISPSIFSIRRLLRPASGANRGGGAEGRP